MLILSAIAVSTVRIVVDIAMNVSFGGSSQWCAEILEVELTASPHQESRIKYLLIGRVRYRVLVVVVSNASFSSVVLSKAGI
jgi:hypothetical protein